VTIFLILAPYGVFAGLTLISPATTSLFTAAAICVSVIVLDVLGGRSIKMLGLGSAIIFAALGTYLALGNVVWSSSAVKLAVDIGVLTIALVSLLLHRPFTLQYTREMVDAKTAKSPAFLSANYVITWAWVLAFLLMILANALLIYAPGLPLWSGLAIVFAARNTAVYFTRWYPEHRRAKHAAISPDTAKQKAKPCATYSSD
jgi:hypothetical protein